MKRQGYLKNKDKYLLKCDPLREPIVIEGTIRIRFVTARQATNEVAFLSFHGRDQFPPLSSHPNNYYTST